MPNSQGVPSVLQGKQQLITHLKCYTYIDIHFALFIILNDKEN